MKLLSTLLLLGTVGAFNGHAQGTASVKGTVLDDQQQPAPFANVLLLNPADSALVQGVTTEIDGQFALESSKAGKFLLLYSVIGFEKHYQSIQLENGKTLQLAPVQLQGQTQALGEVKVVAKKPFIEQLIDRTVVNVENSVVAAGATALEVLERSPGITVDQQNERLKLRGKDGVIVQIDGKQSFLSEQELMQLLKNTPSENIEKIELITNPSSKYDAAGNSGIINIRFKKNKNYGTNGNVTVGAGIGDRHSARGNGSVSLNHREGKISLFGTASAFEGKGFNINDIQRSIPFEGGKTYFDQYSDMNWKGKNYSFRAGADYYLSDKTTIGVLASGFLNAFDGPRVTDVKMLNTDRELTQTYNTLSTTDNYLDNFTGNVNFKHQFDNKGKELTFDVDYVRYTRSGNTNMDTKYFDGLGQPTGLNEIMRSETPMTINIGVAKLDYVKPLAKGKLELGAKTSIVGANNNMIFENQFDSQWYLDTTRSNSFEYKENISAVYGNYSGKLNEKTSFQLGLRTEYTYSSGNSVTMNKVNTRNYLNLFPSVFVSRTLDSSNVVNLSYSYRIDRPNYQSLNPFEYYLDPYTFSRGNPFLKPQYTHAFQVVHVYKQFLNTTFAYSRTKDMIVGEVTHQIPEKNQTYIMPDNLKHNNHWSLNVAMPIPVAKWWNMQTSATAIYTQFNTIYREAEYDISAFTWNGNVNNTFTLGKGWTAELSGWYNSPGIYQLFRGKSMGAINAGIQKTVLQKKGTIRVNVNDIFAMSKFRGTTQFQDIDLTVRSEWGSRQVRATFSYRFGNQNVKVRNRNTGSADIQQRVGNN